VVLPYFCWLAGGKIVFPPLILFWPLCRGRPWRPALRRRVRGTPVMAEALLAMERERSRSALASTTSMPSFPSSSSSSPQNPNRRRRSFSSNVVSLSGVCAAVPAGHVPLSLSRPWGEARESTSRGLASPLFPSMGRAELGSSTISPFATELRCQAPSSASPCPDGRYTSAFSLSL
jgi:hypothetical protein